MYREALRYDRRPELYFSLGETYLAMENVEEAHRYFVATALFGIDLFGGVPVMEKERAWKEAFALKDHPEAYTLP